MTIRTVTCTAMEETRSRAYGYSFNDKIGLRQIIHACACTKALAGCNGFTLGYAFLGDVLFQELVWKESECTTTAN